MGKHRIDTLMALLRPSTTTSLLVMWACLLLAPSPVAYGSDDLPHSSAELVRAAAADPAMRRRHEDLRKLYAINLNEWNIGMSVSDIALAVRELPRHHDAALAVRKPVLIGTAPPIPFRGDLPEGRLYDKGVSEIYGDWRMQSEFVPVGKRALIIALAGDLSRASNDRIASIFAMATNLAIAYIPDVALDLAELSVLVASPSERHQALIRLGVVQAALTGQSPTYSLRLSSKRAGISEELLRLIKPSGAVTELKEMLTGDVRALQDRLDKPSVSAGKPNKEPYWANVVQITQSADGVWAGVKEPDAIKAKVQSIVTFVNKPEDLTAEMSIELLALSGSTFGRWHPLTGALLMRLIDSGRTDYVIIPQELIYIGVAIERRFPRELQSLSVFALAHQLGVTGKPGDAGARRGHDWFNAMEAATYIGQVVVDAQGISTNKRLGDGLVSICKYSIVIANDPDKWTPFPPIYEHRHMIFNAILDVSRVFDRTMKMKELQRGISDPVLPDGQRKGFIADLIGEYFESGDATKYLSLVNECIMRKHGDAAARYAVRTLYIDGFRKGDADWQILAMQKAKELVASANFDENERAKIKPMLLHNGIDGFRIEKK
jgi:hypothetical protein